MFTAKNHKIVKNLLLYRYDDKLIDLLLWAYIRYSKLTITSGYREGDPGVHGQNPCRGADIRSWHYNDPQAAVNDINKHWIYDPNRPKKQCAILHDIGRGVHIHLQSHPLTERR